MVLELEGRAERSRVTAVASSRGDGLHSRQLPSTSLEAVTPCSPQLRTILPELPDFISSMASLNSDVRKAVRDDRGNIEAALDHGRHFVQGLVHFAAVNAFDGERTKHERVPIDGSAAGHDA